MTGVGGGLPVPPGAQGTAARGCGLICFPFFFRFARRARSQGLPIRTTILRPIQGLLSWLLS